MPGPVSPLEPTLRYSLTVRVSQINHCRFCVDLNSAVLLERGSIEDKLWVLEDSHGSSMFTERERVAPAYAEAITRSNLEVTDDLWHTSNSSLTTTQSSS